MIGHVPAEDGFCAQGHDLGHRTAPRSLEKRGMYVRPARAGNSDDTSRRHDGQRKAFDYDNRHDRHVRAGVDECNEVDTGSTRG